MVPIQPSGFRSLSSPVPRLLLRQCQREALDLEGDDGTIFCLEIRQWIGSRGHLNQKPWENDNEGKSFPEIMFFHETLVFPVNVPWNQSVEWDTKSNNWQTDCHRCLHQWMLTVLSYGPVGSPKIVTNCYLELNGTLNSLGVFESRVDITPDGVGEWRFAPLRLYW